MKRENLHSDHRSRLRGRLLSCGAEALAEHELLEFLLFTPIRRRNTNPIAHRLIDKFGSLFAVLEAPVDELMKVDGMGEVSARFIRDFGRAVEGIVADFDANMPTVKTPREALLCASRLFESGSADALYIALDGTCRMIAATELPASPASRDLLMSALKAPSFGAIIAFNQPGGTAAKAPNDTAVGLFRQILAPMNTYLFDVLILGESGVSFFAQNRTLDSEYILPQEPEGAVTMHQDVAMSLPYGHETSEPPESAPSAPFGDYDLADAIPAGSIAAELARNSVPTVSSESRRLIDSARKRNAKARTRRGKPLPPELDALIGPHIDPDMLDDDLFETYCEELRKQQKSE